MLGKAHSYCLHVFCVYAVVQQKPSKELVLRLTFAFPNPSRECMVVNHAEVKFIYISGDQVSLTGVAYPFVMINC